MDSPRLSIFQGVCYGLCSLAKCPGEGRSQIDIEIVSGRSQALLELKDLANAKLESGDAEEAAEQYTIALLRLKEVAAEVQAESQTLKALLLANRAQAHLKLQHWELALADCEACLKIQPDNAKALHRQSLAQHGLAEDEKRRSHGEVLKQALFCKTAGNKLLTDRQFEAAMRKYSEGLEWIEDLDQIGRDTWIALRANRCQARLKCGLWSEALEDAEAILLKEPGHPKARYRRAKALLELGRRQEAADALQQMDPSNEDVAELLRLVAAPAAPGPTAVPAATEATEVTELVRGRHCHGVQRSVAEDAEAKRLLKEAEAAIETRKDFRLALKFADGASVELERLRAQDRREKARQLAQQLLAVHVLQVRCHLALKDFSAARELAQRALKLHHYEEERLEREFNMAAALRSCTAVVETMQAVVEASDALSSDIETVQAMLRRLEKVDFTAPLRAALLVRRATLSSDEADIRRALVLDPSCKSAQDLLKNLKAGASGAKKESDLDGTKSDKVFKVDLEGTKDMKRDTRHAQA
ncbi:unnamed protein product [Cladocopium goreaui]|uniref:Sperm-associated antigen 1 (HSD-3.8) (Infertility-related sperm protein Spag-1) n=1 Tax=Cladocopium goreaui TaxID=2562237 RepID=A0A9P1M537_9DINO|nr:unnamed protein product [Cladocopium goreaui]